MTKLHSFFRLSQFILVLLFKRHNGYNGFIKIDTPQRGELRKNLLLLIALLIMARI